MPVPEYWLTDSSLDGKTESCHNLLCRLSINTYIWLSAKFKYTVISVVRLGASPQANICKFDFLGNDFTGRSHLENYEMTHISNVDLNKNLLKKIGVPVRNITALIKIHNTYIYSSGLDIWKIKLPSTFVV